MLRSIFMCKKYLLALLLCQPLHAQQDSYLEYEDFLFDINEFINKNVKVQVPVIAVDIPSRTAHVDLTNVAVSLKKVPRQKIKNIVQLCDGVGGSCFLDVSGKLVENSDYFPPFILEADTVSLWFLVGLAVSESGLAFIHVTENQAAISVQEATSYSENYVSDQTWIDGPGTLAIAHGSGGVSFYMGYSFNVDESQAAREAESNCNDQMSSLAKIVTSCSSMLFTIPWW